MDLLSLEKIFKELYEADVRYVVVGGLAVVAHGYLRFTADIDLFIDLKPGNIEKAVQVFSDLGYQPRAPVLMQDFIRDDIRTSWFQDKNLRVFSLWNPDQPATEVDIFVESPMNFSDAEKNSKVFETSSGLKMRVIGLEDLIQLKLLAGRQKDIDDIENLRKLKAAQDE